LTNLIELLTGYSEVTMLKQHYNITAEELTAKPA
jgi:hypothetical protein